MYDFDVLKLCLCHDTTNVGSKKQFKSFCHDVKFSFHIKCWPVYIRLVVRTSFTEIFFIRGSEALSLQQQCLLFPYIVARIGT